MHFPSKVGLAAIAAFLFSSSSAFAAAGGCHEVSGTFVGESAPCAVPAVVCFEDVVSGDLAGESHTTITAFDPVTRAFSGTVVIDLESGAVIAATINGVGTPFHEAITGGTRQFAHATGFIDGVSGAHGTYSGEYCLADTQTLE